MQHNVMVWYQARGGGCFGEGWHNQKTMEQVLRSAFISYSRLSERFVQQIVDDLKRCGVEDVWWDDHLTGGQDWWQHILQQIRQADALVCLVDVGASESLAVRREYKYANDLGKTVIPILLTEDINVSQLPDELAGKQYVDYRPSNSQAYNDLSMALRELPPAQPLPASLPPEPERPRSATDYIVGRVSSPERLNEEAQNSVLNQLRRLAVSEEKHDRELAHGWLKKLRNRPELNAQVADDIDAIIKNNSLVEKPSGWFGKIAGLTAIIVIAIVGYLQFIGNDEGMEPVVDTSVPNDVGEVISTADATAPAVAVNETDTSKEKKSVSSVDQNGQAKKSETGDLAVTVIPEPVTAAETLSLVVPEQKAEPEPEPIKELAVTNKSQVYWKQDFSEFLETPFDLCGFKRFTVSVAEGDGDGDGDTVLVIRSADRSIPDQPFRGLEKQIPNKQLVELFPGCRVQISYNNTSRIRMQVQGEK